ncbi:methyltransferase [Caulobacter phage CcrBL9]|uniref:FkbM family methyltransferase n=1 Tax=Caulobacter phage CcrBL9 TaxID=2283270 RepID=A0A385EEC3_9CAUD|nr:methyltransferase [Caulobacter phage CcrBL9]AXQ69202.1 FkbM family methyltransferase [Caulobacter phage CcrBL9]
MSDTISEAYRSLNAALHGENPSYGANGWQWIGPVLHFAQAHDARSILDYGCGKDSFARWAPQTAPNIRYESYDPAIPEHAAPPPICDFVACLDVLEHIEPDHLDAVLADIRDHMRLGGFFVICLRAAKKELPDGRNAHLIIESDGWWIDRLKTIFGAVHKIKGLSKDSLVVHVER